MSKQIQIPDIGGDEVTVTEVMVKAGDKIEVDQSIINVEGDKASMEVPAPEAGIVKEVLVKVGDKVSTGTPMLVLEQADTVATAEAPSQQAVSQVASGVASSVVEVNVPDIGGDEVNVTEIMVAVGDTVAEEQSLITVEGDKASMEVPAPFAGKVVEILIKQGDKVATGSLIMKFEVTGAEAQASTPVATQPQATQTTTSGIVDVNVPDIGGDEVNVTEIMVAVGDTVGEEQSLITVEGDKASMEVPAPFAGKVVEILVKEGDKVATGSLIMRFEVAQAEPATAETKAPASAPAAPTQTQASTPKAPDSNQNEVVAAATFAHATPVVRRLAREFGVNLDKVKGTGRKGRILKEDVQAYVKAAVKAVESGAVSTTTTTGGASGAGLGLLPWPKVDFSKFGETEEVELGRIQKISGANLHRNWVMIPHVTQWDKADITELEKFRKEQNVLAEKQKLEVKITPLVFIMKAAAKALEAYPRFNSSLSEDGQRLTLKKYVNIGVAVDTPNGLVVPVFRDVNKKGIIELSRELAEISKKARSGLSLIHI